MSASLSPTRYLASVVIGAGAVTSLLGTAGPRKPVAIPTMRIVAEDYRYELPAEVPSGVTRLTLVNRGHELHHAQLVRLEQGKTVADMAQLRPDAPPPAWVVPVGGPNAVGPGDSSSVVQSLAPGNYALFCFIPSLSDHKEHRFKGMVAAFRVTENRGPQARLPQADLTVRTLDFGFAPSAPITAGHRTIRVVNDGPQLHELVLALLPPGKTAADLLAWNPETATEPPPARYLGGVVGLVPGGEALVEADLAPGNYVLICYIPDAKDGKPHLAHGMVLPITVKAPGA
ncbi:MAG TPA: hypothetical protein VG692_03955 [Gemmatimonadales bacterium]|nr:hypothetical protein [Gemmatimonadales bacterium]